MHADNLPPILMVHLAAQAVLCRQVSCAILMPFFYFAIHIFLRGDSMQRLASKRIILGIGGGIAAYKAAELVRRLKDQGADVRVVMTRSAREFITPLTLQALSGHPVHLDLLDPAAEAAMGHIELARWADLVLIAPARDDFMTRLAQAKGHDLLTTVCLATAGQIALAPAMNQGMWRNTSTQ